jgi:hypothetical protein
MCPGFVSVIRPYILIANVVSIPCSLAHTSILCSYSWRSPRYLLCRYCRYWCSLDDYLNDTIIRFCGFSPFSFLVHLPSLSVDLVWFPMLLPVPHFCAPSQVTTSDHAFFFQSSSSSNSVRQELRWTSQWQFGLFPQGIVTSTRAWDKVQPEIEVSHRLFASNIRTESVQGKWYRE